MFKTDKFCHVSDRKIINPKIEGITATVTNYSKLLFQKFRVASWKHQSYKNEPLASKSASLSAAFMNYLDEQMKLEALDNGSQYEEQPRRDLPDSCMEQIKTSLNNRYIILNRLGSGSVGVVLKAFDTYTRKHVAVKCMCKTKFNFMHLTRDRLMGSVPSEVQILSKISHRNIVKFVEFRQDSVFFYVITDCPSEQDLFDLIEKCYPNLSEFRMKNIFRQIVEAVKFLHDSNYVHRDIKDENILLDENDQVYLIDFGFSKKIPVSSDQMFQEQCGTPHAMAPEIWRKFPHRGVEQDVWSLGVLLYTLAFGQPPFEETNHILVGRIRPTTTDRKELMSLIRSMLEPDLKRRIRIDEILSHRWLSSRAFSEDSGSDVSYEQEFDELISFYTV